MCYHRAVLLLLTAPATNDRTRLVCIEEVHGLAGCNNWGASKFLFAPETTGRDFTLVPDNPLSTLEKFRDQMTIISNTDVRNAEAFLLPEIGGDHFRSSAVFLTQSHPKQTNGSDLFAGTSMDQMYAQRFGQGTPMPSMQFCIENLDQAGGCTYNYSCAYTDTISWASPSEPLPMIRDPRVAFDMLFGAGASADDRAARRDTRKSILDWISGEVERVRRQLGTGDRQRLDRYMDNVREIERRIQAVEARGVLNDPPAFARDLFVGPHPAGGGDLRQGWLGLVNWLSLRNAIQACAPRSRVGDDLAGPAGGTFLMFAALSQSLLCLGQTV